MTRQPRRWRPTLARRAAKTRQIVIGMRSHSPTRHPGPGSEASQSCNSQRCVFFEHRPPPFPRLARQAGERGGQPGATTNPTRQMPARPILISCGSAVPINVGAALPSGVLPIFCLRGCCCFLPGRNVLDSRPAHTPGSCWCQALFYILPGG